MSTHGFDLGSLDLASSDVHDDGFTLSVLGDDAMFGSSQAVVREIVSQLADGSRVVYDRAGNRQVEFAVLVEGADGVALQAGEVALRRELYRPNIVTWTPPADFSAPTVFEIVASEMSPQFSDLDELRLQRKFRVTLTCAPFARSADPVTVQALVAGSTLTNVDTCASATGWSATRSGAPDTASTAWEAGSVGVAELNDAITSPETWTLTRTGSVDFSTTPYLVVQVRTIATGVGEPMDVKAYAGTSAAGTLLPVLDIRAATGYFVVTYDASGLPGGSAAALTFVHRSTPGHIWQGMFISNVARSNIPPGATARQQSRIIETVGTERTPLSIFVAPGSSGSSVGWTIVQTMPEELAGHSPSLRQFRSSGNSETTDAALISGKREAVNATPVVAQIPLTSLPEGEYALVALMRSSVIGTFDLFWEARTLLPGIGYLGGTSGHVSAEFTAVDTWTLIPFDVVTLPPVRSNGAFVQINLSRDVVAAEVIQLDEWWTLRMGDDCATTILVDSAAFLWLDSPDVSSGVPRVWVGGDGDRSDAHHPSFNLFAQGAHLLHPDGTAIFVATSGLEYPDVSATYYPRYHSNAAS